MMARWCTAIALATLFVSPVAAQADTAALEAQIRKIVAEELQKRVCTATTAQTPPPSAATVDVDAVSTTILTSEPTVPAAVSAPTNDKFGNPTDRAGLAPLAGAAGIATSDRDTRRSRTTVEIQASADKTTATIAIPLVSTTTNDGTTITEKAWSIKASAPVDNAKENSASFATLNGLASGVTLGSDWTYSTTPVIQVDLWTICQTLDRDVSLSDCTVDAVNERMASVNDSDLPEAWKALLGASKRSITFNLRGEVGHRRHTYFAGPLVPASKDSKIGWSVGGSVGRVSGNREHYVGGGFDFVHSYKDRDPRVVCAQSDAAIYDCTQGSFGPPKDVLSRVLFAEFRTVTLGRPVSLKVSHDLASDKSAVDLPIFLLANEAQNYTGGLRLGWTSTDHFIAGLFVGRAFGISGR
ncbi:hypothetical protein [Tahibacter amnicola]|uniref:Uncharacterized protein n=1 Tax=Tahibacter amnicola TaxID=2976241 RepID=A0ABY6B9B0_9GAMM|nr:hypothetical protein [Tahibacter amnicola]UXI65780.1 hypothetical protein N4264_13500 [Tahibacter amnicola]